MIFANEVIISRNNPAVKLAASLKEKKGRYKAALFMAEGAKLTAEALSSGLPVEKIYVAEDCRERALSMLEKYSHDEKFEKTVVQTVSRGVFEKISTENSPEGVISIIKHLDFLRQMDIIYKEDFSREACGRSIALCSVRDPGNLGAVIRSAVAFGVEEIILSGDCADIYNPKTVRGAMGSLFRVNVRIVGDMKEYIRAMQANGRRVYSAELSESAVPLSDLGLDRWDSVIIGNEGHGIPAEISAMTDASVYIPISSRTESLNASVAAAIFMWEQSKTI
ncbi:MAG: RNA methyltransferase [Ruminococcaceae bacterium]|nr:RNA methyltransferase [Oscillospiraceae bacterium]